MPWSLRTRALGTLALAIGCACAAAAGPASGATGSTVVGATVPSATTIDVAGCLPGTPNVTEIGVVLPGSSATTTSDCIVEFGSSNDTSMLRLHQQDGFGQAMFGATSGALDTNSGDGDHFSTDGKATINPSGTGEANGAGVQRLGSNAGKTIVVGYSHDNDRTLIARLNADGTPDNTFGNSGGATNWTILDVDPTRAEEAESVFVMDDDRLVVAGQTYDGSDDPDWVVMRLTADGLPDPTFNGGSPVQLDLGGFDPAPSPIVDDADRVVLGGSSESDAVIGRLTAAGQWDTTFGTSNGRTRLTFPDDFEDTVTLLRQSTGRYVIVGTQIAGSDFDIALAGFTSAGLADGSFGSGGTGRRVTDLAGGEDDEVEDAVLLSDDSIVVAGEHNPSGPSQVMVAKYTPNGALASGSFGGPTGTGPGYSLFLRDANGSKAEGVLAQLDDRILVGITDDLSSGDFGAIRVHSNGTADSSFSAAAGIASGSDDMDALAWGHDGKPLLIGDSGSDLAVFRLDAPRIADWSPPTTNWASGTNLFAACLHSVSNGGATDGSTWSATGSCGVNDAHPWNDVPSQSGDAGAKVAVSPTSDDDARAHLRFGMRAATTQAAGSYWAPIAFEVVAPAA